MQRILCLRFPNWPVQRYRMDHRQVDHPILHTPLTDPGRAAKTRRQRDSPAEADLKAVRQRYTGTARSAFVMAITEAAFRAGIRVGMPHSEAVGVQRILSPSANQPSLTFAEWEPAADRQALIEIAETLRAFGPIVGLDGMFPPDSLLLDITGCGELFGGESALAEQLHRRIRQQGQDCMIVIADTIGSAWAIAHASRTDAQDAAAVVVIPPGRHLEEIDPLPIELLRLETDDQDSLQNLGIRRIAQLRALPREDLPTRFSDSLPLRIDQAVGDVIEQITPLPERHPVRARWSTEFGVIDLAPLRIVIERLTENLADQLQKRGLGAIEIECRFASAEAPEISTTAHLIQATADTAHLCQVLQLALESITVDAPVNDVQLTASVSPMPIHRQRTLFDSHESEDLSGQLVALLERLTGRLGTQSVLQTGLQSDSRPEKSEWFSPAVRSGEVAESAADRIRKWLGTDSEPTCIPSDGETSQTPANADGVAWVPIDTTRRPLRLLNPLVRIAEAPHDPRASNWSWNAESFHTVHSIGPERIECDWWQDDEIARDYYRLMTSDHRQFWCFVNRDTGDWFLHGVFD